jgi:hypothetical protein
MPGNNQKLMLDMSDIEKMDIAYRLREESRRCHPELILASRPSVQEIVEQAAILKGYFDNKFIKPGERTPCSTSDVTFYKHQVGDGLHYTDNHIISLNSNILKPGSTSESCILKSVYIVSARQKVGRLAEMWNRVYQDDPLSRDDLTSIIAVGVYFTESFNPMALENILDTAADLRSIKCDALADLFEERAFPNLGTFI